MIDPKLFNPEELVARLLATDKHPWRAYVEILVGEHWTRTGLGTRELTGTKVLVRIAGCFLRYSCGPRQGFFWDIYGDDFQTPELALLAISQAPTSPSFMRNPTGEEP